MAPSSDAMRPACSRAWVSIPAACIDSTSSKAKPSRRSITSTRSVTSVGCGRGTMIPRCSVSASTRRDVEHVLRLEPEVELLDDRLGEQLDQRRRVGERGRRGCGPTSRGASHDRAAMSSRKQLGDPGPLHLDHDLLTGAQAGGVDLGDRRRRDRGLVEPLEELLERAAEVDLDHRAHVGEGLGRHLVAQELELGDQLVGEQALATGDDLAELHVARAQPLERGAQPPGDAGA